MQVITDVNAFLNWKKISIWENFLHVFGENWWKTQHVGRNCAFVNIMFISFIYILLFMKNVLYVYYSFVFNRMLLIFLLPFILNITWSSLFLPLTFVSSSLLHLYHLLTLIISSIALNCLNSFVLLPCNFIKYIFIQFFIPLLFAN